MEVFYCSECGKWHNLDDANSIETKSATWEQPAEYSDDLYCDHCCRRVDEENIFEDALEVLNTKKVEV